MTRTEVFNKFKILIDKSADVSFGGYPAFLDSEIEVFLNQATREVISNKYTGTQNQVGFEGSNKRIADLQGLIGTAVLSGTSHTNISNAITFELPVDFLFYVDAQMNINDNEIYQIDLTTHEIAKNFAVTHDNDPYLPVAKAVLEGNKLLVYYDKHIVKNTGLLLLGYIYNATLFVEDVVNEKLTESLVDEIINRAVLIALENIEAPRTETKAQLNSIQE